MHSTTQPSQIQFGWVREMRYLPDFGRYEAAVILHVIDAAKGESDVELITSVAAHPDEAPRALRQRLVFDAARLMRLSEAGLDDEEALPQAA